MHPATRDRLHRDYLLSALAAMEAVSGLACPWARWPPVRGDDPGLPAADPSVSSTAGVLAATTGAGAISI